MTTGKFRVPLALAALLVLSSGSLAACSTATEPAAGASSSSIAIPVPSDATATAAPSSPGPEVSATTADTLSPSDASTPTDAPSGSASPSPAEPGPAQTPECPTTANSSIKVSEGETFVSEEKLTVAAGKGIALFVDTDVKFPYRVAGTTISGEFPPGQQVLCFALPKTGQYALLSGERVVLELTAN